MSRQLGTRGMMKEEGRRKKRKRLVHLCRLPKPGERAMLNEIVFVR